MATRSRNRKTTMLRVYVFSIVCCVSCLGQEILKYSILEELPRGKFIGDIREDSNLRATVSADDFSQITYSVLDEGKTYEKYFTVNSKNGSLYTKAVIDRESLTNCVYETTCVLPLSIVAKSQISAFFRTLKVNITIKDINDNVPVFPKHFTSLEISEVATVGSSMSLDGAVDADAGNYSLQRYYILNEALLDFPFTLSYERFVDGSSGVKLEITGDLDRETEDSYGVIIVAEDGGNPALTGTMSVNINIDDTNDNEPEFASKLYNATVNETMDVGEEIIQVSATDADIGINSEIVYSLSKNQIGKIQELFAINETTGILYVNKKFESGGQFRIIVEATDKGTQPLMTQAIVVVTVLDSDNNRPEIKVNLFSDSGMATISEYADLGTVVAHVKVIDKDTGANGIITCDIDSDNKVFTLQGLDVNEYKVTVAKGLDRESMDFIFVVINCYDKGAPPQTTFVEFSVKVIDENDHSPIFLQKIYFVDILENNTVNSDIVQVSAIDNDIGKNGEISYSVWATGDYRFTMDPLSGLIKTQSVFDREKMSSIKLYAYAKDNGSPARTSTATVMINVLDLNDNVPMFEKPFYEFNVSENVAVDTSVSYVVASDPDDDDNAKLGFHIDKSVPFKVDSRGIIRTKEVLDREESAIYSFLVIAYDHGMPSLNTSTNVVVHVLDKNDHVPKFIFPDIENYTVELRADTLPKSVVAKIKALDLDEGLNGELFYTIQNSNVSDLFTINGNTGEITLVRPLQSSDEEIYNILLRVDDKGNPSQYSTTSVNIFIARKQPLSPVTDSKGENLLIAITLSVVTFVLVFTIVLVICILKRKWFRNKDNSCSEETFCEKVKPSKERRVKFADMESGINEKSTSITKTPPFETMTTFSSDGNDSRDSDMTASTVDMETPILEKHKVPRERASPITRHSTEQLPGPSDSSHEMKQCTPRSEDGKPHFDTKTRSDSQLKTLKSHSTLLNTSIKPHTTISAFGLDDNHSHTSGETVTSDSGRGGSESDIHSASLSNSHDSDIRLPSDLRNPRANSTFIDQPRPWLNLADLRHHNCPRLPVAQQLHNDRKHRLQLRDFTDRNSSRNKPSVHQFNRGPYTQSDNNFDRHKVFPVSKPPVFPPPPSDLDRSYMTYEEEDDDLSTTTSGSYTIDHEDVSLDLRSPPPNAHALRGCLV
ncbi:protocadherin alpha-13-like [Mercenaria mercenaria]|uniref:protocadherin alpha-13-like n=1 Tax=Mercenaria mercenaria TaxID=6596 RepID=UPI00234F6DEF|nr:protocadherin alpha-13-like [Mercenaria mercenaria]